MYQFYLIYNILFIYYLTLINDIKSKLYKFYIIYNQIFELFISNLINYLNYYKLNSYIIF